MAFSTIPGAGTDVRPNYKRNCARKASATERGFVLQNPRYWRRISAMTPRNGIREWQDFFLLDLPNPAKLASVRLLGIRPFAQSSSLREDATARMGEFVLRIFSYRPRISDLARRNFIHRIHRWHGLNDHQPNPAVIPCLP